MNAQNIEQFVKKIDQDPSLQEQLRSAIEGERLAAKIVELGRANDYNFTITEVEEWLSSIAAQAQSQSGVVELSESELESVAGGADLVDVGLTAASFLGGPIGGLVCGAAGLTKSGAKSTFAKKFGAF